MLGCLRRLMPPQYDEPDFRATDKYTNHFQLNNIGAVCFWKNLPKFVGMKTSIDFLPRRKQNDLRELVAIARKEIKDVAMIILFGSYAKNKFVDCDVTNDYGITEFYISDYDLLIVTKRSLGGKEPTVKTRIREEFLLGKNQFQTTPQIITESIKKLNNELSEGHCFYVDIVNEGIMLYDSREYTLETPRELDYRDIESRAAKFYLGNMRNVANYWEDGIRNIENSKCTHASFFLHQVTEYLLKAIPLVYILYRYKEHDLDFLIEKCKLHTLEVARVFPRNTPEEKRLFELLQRAYVEARYNDEFVVTKEEIDTLLPKIELLRQIVEKVCKERFEYYDRQIRK